MGNPTFRRVSVEQLEDRTVPATFFAGVAANYTITNDVGAPGLSAGDTVTFLQGTPQEAAGLIFGTQAFDVIQDAINASSANDEVQIGPDGGAGYNEALTINVPGLLLRGATGIVSDVTINAGGALNGIDVLADNVTLNHFTIQGASDAGIHAGSLTSIQINGVTSRSHGISPGIGTAIAFANVANVNISSTRAETSMGDGLFVSGATNLTLSQVTAQSNGLVGVAIFSSSTVTIDNVVADLNGDHNLLVQNVATLNARDLQLPGMGGTGNLFDTIDTFNYRPTTGNANDTVIVSFDGILHIRNGNLQQFIDLDTINTVNADGDGGDDILVLDFSSGSPFPNSALNVNGGAGNDAISMSGGTVGLIHYLFGGPTSGSIQIDGQMLNYLDLEPISDNLNAFHRIFEFSSADDVVTLETDMSPGLMRIHSLGTSETVSFAVPEGFLDVVLGPGNDTFQVLSLDPIFDSLGTLLAIDGNEGNDTISGSDRGDEINGGPGNDLLMGGPGEDEYEFDDNWGADVIVEVNPDNLLEFDNLTMGITIEIGSDFGEPTDMPNRLTFDSDFFHEIEGTDFDDFFVLVGDVVTSISIDAEEGFDTLDYSLYTADVVVDGANFSATGWDEVEDIENVIPSGTASTTVSGVPIGEIPEPFAAMADRDVHGRAGGGSAVEDDEAVAAHDGDEPTDEELEVVEKVADTAKPDAAS